MSDTFLEQFPSLLHRQQGVHHQPEVMFIWND